jgi:hypothetical protein
MSIRTSIGSRSLDDEDDDIFVLNHSVSTEMRHDSELRFDSSPESLRVVGEPIVSGRPQLVLETAWRRDPNLICEVFTRVPDARICPGGGPH